MAAIADPDQQLVEAMLAPHPLTDARSSLAYWQSRRRKLPLYRRAARREADAMIAHWQEQIRLARRQRLLPRLVDGALERLGLDAVPQRRALVPLVVSLLLWLVPRRIVVGAAVVLVGVATAAVLVAVALVALAQQL